MMNIHVRMTKYLWPLFCLTIFIVIGCATSKKEAKIAAPLEATNLIKKITVVDGPEGKVVTIVADQPLTNTYFRIVPAPLQLVIDIPQVTLASETAIPITLEDEVIKGIAASQRDVDVEVSIGLHKLVNYQAKKEGNTLTISLGREVPLLAKEAQIKEETPAAPVIKEERIEEVLPLAQRLVDLSIDKSYKDRVIIQIRGDGQLGDYDSFGLLKPTRLVLDVWKVRRGIGKKAFEVNTPYVKRVRLGDYPQKVRVVLDIPAAAIPSHRIDRIGDTIAIILGTKEAIAALPPTEPTPAPVKKKEVTAAPHPKEEVRPQPTKGEVTAIDFKQLEDRSRIIIATSAKANYKVSEGPEGTVVLDLPGMSMPSKLKRPLDTHEFVSPVLLITPVGVTVDKQKGTQIIVKLRKMVPYDVKQEDAKIYLDFERTEEFRGEKPKPVEVVTVKKPIEEKPVEERPAEAKEEVAKKEAAPAAAPKGKPSVPAVGEEVPEKVYTGKRITLDFKDADIANILRLFAEVSDLNIIASGDVKGTVTIRLVDVPWDQAFDIILEANNLGAERIGNVVRIAPLERIRAERRLRAEAAKATEEIEPLVTEVIPINYGNVKEIGEQGIKPILSSRGKVVVDERTNTLVVTDIKSNVEKAKQLVRTLDAQTPQVLIQAQVIEANLDFSRELGIQWGGSFETSDSKGSFTGSGASSGDWAVDIPATVGTGAGGALQFAIANIANTKYLQIRLSALEETGQGKIISSPRLTTLDNTEASIEQGLRIPYIKLTEEGTATTDFVEANLKLTVTPHVTSDGYIRMELDVKKDTPDYSKTDIYGTPAIDKKEIKTEVLVKDGEVLVLGGIYTYTKTGSVDAVPFFYKIPLLGWLFQKKGKEENKRELLIFIAPTIVQPRRITTS